jgi:hypothetical protein
VRFITKVNQTIFQKKTLERILGGDPGRIDPNVPIEYQTEFLPYDKKWEFPRKRLRLGLLFSRYFTNDLEKNIKYNK